MLQADLRPASLADQAGVTDPFRAEPAYELEKYMWSFVVIRAISWAFLWGGVSLFRGGEVLGGVIIGIVFGMIGSMIVWKARGVTGEMVDKKEVVLWIVYSTACGGNVGLFGQPSGIERDEFYVEFIKYVIGSAILGAVGVFLLALVLLLQSALRNDG